MTGITGSASAAAIVVLSVSLLSACGKRPDSWDEPVVVSHVSEMASTVVLVDSAIPRLAMITVGRSGKLETAFRETGKNVSATAVSPDKNTLFVLARGSIPRSSSSDELPGLWVYDGIGKRNLKNRYTLDASLGGITVDPEGRYVIAHSNGDSDAFVQNPNELAIIDISQPPSESNPTLRTLRSYGGAPERLTFTQSLDLPSGKKRLLVVETGQEITLLDLDHPDRSEITITLSSGAGASSLSPTGIAVDNGDPSKTDDTRIAVRTNQASLFLLSLRAVPEGKHSSNDYEVGVNMAVLSGVATSIAFVQTNAGLRLASLIPSKKQASLLDLDTMNETTVDLPAAYGSMVLVPGVATAGGGTGDVALLWGGRSSAKGVALWSLADSVDLPYLSIESLNGVADSIWGVEDVPNTDGLKKILVPSYSANSASLFMLDLQKRTAAPLFAASSNTRSIVSNDGKRVWLYQEYGFGVACVGLDNLHPVNLYLDRFVSSVFDIESENGGRAGIAMHPIGSWGATVFDAMEPSDASSSKYYGLLFGGF